MRVVQIIVLFIGPKEVGRRSGAAGETVNLWIFDFNHLDDRPPTILELPTGLVICVCLVRAENPAGGAGERCKLPGSWI